MLFTGPSGTGKTLAAETLAKQLKLELYKIGLPSVISKYIGETEKNLNKLFVKAERGDYILFFDEADALFGKRFKVTDAHDRYANIEVSHLLQHLEDYQGVVILASNLKPDIDSRFKKTFQYIVDF